MSPRFFPLPGLLFRSQESLRRRRLRFSPDSWDRNAKRHRETHPGFEERPSRLVWGTGRLLDWRELRRRRAEVDMGWGRRGIPRRFQHVGRRRQKFEHEFIRFCRKLGRNIFTLRFQITVARQKGASQTATGLLSNQIKRWMVTLKIPIKCIQFFFSSPGWPSLRPSASPLSASPSAEKDSSGLGKWENAWRSDKGKKG